MSMSRVIPKANTVSAVRVVFPKRIVSSLNSGVAATVLL